MSMRSRFGRVAAVAALVPIAFSVGLCFPQPGALPFGVGEALGCGGSGAAIPPASGWYLLKPVLMEKGDRAFVPIATDGFFLIDAQSSGLTAEQQASMKVVVTNDAGEPVAGTTKVVSEGLQLFGWTADEPLAVGAKLSATLSAAPLAKPTSTDVGGQFPLEVVGPPTELPEPSLAFDSWVNFYLDAGDEVVSCKTAPQSNCNGTSTSIDVSSAMTKALAAQASWRPEITGGVAWQAHLERGSADSDATFEGVGMRYFFGDDSEPNPSMGRAIFPTQAKEYCATLVIKDLRTEKETRTVTCTAPGKPERGETDGQLGSCLEPPNEALTEAWCQLNADTTFPACSAKPDGGQDGGGAGGESPGTNDAAASTSAESKGCQFGGTSTAPVGGVALLLSLMLLGRRRFSSS